jgi:pyruvate/2-oxoglutarate dehydrogenase complex dihydrolipoamide acyltransferase (E2) component
MPVIDVWTGLSILVQPAYALNALYYKDAAMLTTLKVPKTGGLTTTKVNVVRWLKQEGDSIKKGEPVVELETEKVNYELDSPFDGVLLKIIAREPAEVPVGDPLCQIETATRAASESRDR